MGSEMCIRDSRQLRRVDPAVEQRKSSQPTFSRPTRQRPCTYPPHRNTPAAPASTHLISTHSITPHSHAHGPRGNLIVYSLSTSTSCIIGSLTTQSQSPRRYSPPSRSSSPPPSTRRRSSRTRTSPSPPRPARQGCPSRQLCARRGRASGGGSRL